MADTDFCLTCGKAIGMWDKTCKHCGANQFGENNEFYADEKSIKNVRILQAQQDPDEPKGISSRFSRKKTKKVKEPIFSEEEAFLYGIYPNDEMYRKTMELDILSKNYKQ